MPETELTPEQEQIGEIDIKIMALRNGPLFAELEQRNPDKKELKKIYAKIDRLLDQRLIYMNKK